MGKFERFRTATKNGLLAGFLLENIFVEVTFGQLTLRFELKPHGTNCLKKKKIKSHFGRKMSLVENRIYAAMLSEKQKLACRLTWKQLLRQSLLCTYKISHDITQYQSVARDNPA